VPLITASDGVAYTTCLNPYDSSALQYQEQMGLTLAATATVTILGTFTLGYLALRRVRKQFRTMTQVAGKEGVNQMGVGAASESVKASLARGQSTDSATSGADRRSGREGPADGVMLNSLNFGDVLRSSILGSSPAGATNKQ